MLWLFVACNATADSPPDWLTDKVFKQVVPGAIYAGTLSADPPVATIYGAGKIVGYAFDVSDVVKTTGFSGAPFSIVVGLNIDGAITGVKVVEHAEPILDYGDTSDQLASFVNQYPQLDYTGRVRLASGGQTGEVDRVTGATISVRSFHHAIIQSVRFVSQSLGFTGSVRHSATVDMLNFESLSWNELLATGAIENMTCRHQATRVPIAMNHWNLRQS